MKWHENLRKDISSKCKWNPLFRVVGPLLLINKAVDKGKIEIICINQKSYNYKCNTNKPSYGNFLHLISNTL